MCGDESSVLKRAPEMLFVADPGARWRGIRDEGVDIEFASNLESAPPLSSRPTTGAGLWAKGEWAADELFDILNEYEHSLATPTRTTQPPRHAPGVSKAKAGPR
jgi:hypothetical protein